MKSYSHLPFRTTSQNPPCHLCMDCAVPLPPNPLAMGYVTPTVPGRCNMMIAIVRHPQFAPKPKGLETILGPLLPHTPKWLQHITMHDVSSRASCSRSA